MAWEPSLGVFFGPVTFILLVTCIYFLCTLVQLRRHPERKYELKRLTEEQRKLAAASVDVPNQCHQGTEPGALTAQPSGSHCPVGCPGVPINPALLANEHSFRAQLWTAAFTLFLFLATWTFGALAVSQDDFLDMIFSCLYGAFSVTLGLFVLIHHCAKRDDVWHCWCSCCPKGQHAANGCPAQALGPKVHVNGDTPGQAVTHSHCHHDSMAHCKHGSLASAKNNITCLAPVVTPCCAAFHSQQHMAENEPGGTHVLLHADPEGYQLHSCLKSSTRTKGRHSQASGGEWEFAYHIPDGGVSGDSGSIHSSHMDSPHSTHDRHMHVCPHLALHCDTHRTCHKTPACHKPCHRHICCAKVELFPSLCTAQGDDAGLFLCGCGKVAEQEPTTTAAVVAVAQHHHHMDMHASRRQSYPENPPNQNGILKGGLHEGLLFVSDSTGNIRTGPWKNETTV